MASLKNIMNTEEDHADTRSHIRPQEPGPRSSIHPESPASSSTYIGPSSYLTSSSSHINDSSSTAHPFPSSTSETLIPSSTGGTLSSRRRSNTSTDTMDSSYGHGHGGSSANLPMRPFTPGGSGSEVPYKLTPITKRVSRAKKGVPVHTCDICRPPKTFTRAEHLRRHQLSHQPPDLPCQYPGCEKVFHRRDLLERHHQRHDQEERAANAGGSSSKRQISKSPANSYQDPSRMNMFESGTDPRAVPNVMPESWSVSHPAEVDIPASRMQGSNQNDYYPNIDSAPSNAAGFDSPYEVFIPNDQNAVGLAWQDNSTVSSSDSTYSTPSDTNRHPLFPASTAEWKDQIPHFIIPEESQSPIMSSQAFPLSYTYSSSPPSMYQPVYGDGMGLPMPGVIGDNSLYDPRPVPSTTVGNLAPELAMTQSSETLVTIPSAPSSERLVHPPTCGRQSGEVFGLLTAKDTMLVFLNQAAREAIPAYLKVYWEKVHPFYPIIHDNTFINTNDFAEEHLDMLRCAMAAVATQFIEGKEHRIRGGQLHEYAWYKSKLFTQSEEWPMPIMQTVVLCEYYARFRGRKKESHKSSPRFASLYQRVFNNQKTFTPIRTGRDGNRRWKTWVDMETRRRLLAACFLLDVHSAKYHEHLPTAILELDYSSPDTLPIPLITGTTEAWTARNAKEWSNAYYTAKGMRLQTLSNVGLATLTSVDIDAAHPFDAAILLAACALQLPRRRDLARVSLLDNVADAEKDTRQIAALFPTSGIANAYLALHHTPLHSLLSVSGDTWVFNEKITQASTFTEHQKQFDQWRSSSSAAVAATFAARALRAFLGLVHRPTSPVSNMHANIMVTSPMWMDISDFWGVYACALICWAYGCGRNDISPSDSQGTAIPWIVNVAEMSSLELQQFPGRFQAHGVVTLAREVLSRDCIGGRNRLFEDAVEVLKRLEGNNNWKEF